MQTRKINSNDQSLTLISDNSYHDFVIFTNSESPVLKQILFNSTNIREIKN